MTAQQKKTLWTSAAVTVATGFFTWLLTTAASTAGASKLDTYRFVSDSIRRDNELRAEQAKHNADHDILLRLDSRVGSMFCGRLPVEQRAGCQ
jgi:hypothetical protein